MYGSYASVWGVLTELHDRGAIWALDLGADEQPLVFSDRDAAERFARILANAEERVTNAAKLGGDQLGRWLDGLSLRNAELLLEPEYVAGDGVVGTRVAASEFRTALARAPIAV